MSVFIETLSSGAAELGINLTEAQLALFEANYLMMIEANKSFNLTAIIDEKEAALKHFVDSLTCLRAVAFKKGARILDVGSGAGFPGIPLKICRPDLNITMIEATEKKASFLKKAISELKLESIEAVHTRAEDFGRNKDGREKYDVVVSRAVAALAVLAEYCLPPLRAGGVFIAMKGPNIQGEIKAAEGALAVLGGVLRKTIDIQLPITGDRRKLVVIDKIKATPAIYPRRAGIPAKNPL